MSSILYHAQPTAVGHILNRLHVTWLAGIVDGNNSAGLRSNSTLRVSRVHAKTHRIDVNQDGLRLEVADNFRGRSECSRRHQYLISLLQTNRVESKMKCCSAGTNANGMLCTNVRRKALLEFDRFRPHCKPASADHFGSRFCLFLTNIGNMKRDNLSFDFGHLESAPVLCDSGTR